jgi:hypothetical protein
MAPFGIEEQTLMETTLNKLEAEENRIREQIAGLRREIGALEMRLEEIAKEKEQLPRLRGIEGGFRIVAATEPVGQEPVATKVVPAPGKPVDPVEVLLRSPRGTALFAAEAAAGNRREVVMLVRGDWERIAGLGQSPPTEFRAGLFGPSSSGAVLVPILLRIGPDEAENLYEAWANESVGGLAAVVESLATQPNLSLRLYSDSQRVERTLEVPNPLRGFAKEVLAMLPTASTPPPDAIHQARQAVYRQHPTIRSLWKALKG